MGNRKVIEQESGVLADRDGRKDTCSESGLEMKGPACSPTRMGPDQAPLICLLCSGDVTSLSHCRYHLPLEATGCDEYHSCPDDLHSVPLPSAWLSMRGFMAHNPSPSTKASDNALFVFRTKTYLDQWILVDRW